jgi:hypothetical protein
MNTRGLLQEEAQSIKLPRPPIFKKTREREILVRKQTSLWVLSECFLVDCPCLELLETPRLNWNTKMGIPE